MKILGIAALAGIVLAVSPAEAQRFGFHSGPHLGIGFGFGYVPCGWNCGPYYGPGYYYGPTPYPPPNYGSAYYGPPAPAYRAWRDENRSDRNWHVTRRQGETDFELPDSVLFDLDSARISASAADVLTEIAEAAKSQPDANLVVEGYTDTSGTHEHNQALSDARARAVASALERQGIEQGRIRTEGLGETHLAVQTADGVREPRNRRVVVRLMDARPTAERNDAYHGSRRPD